MAGAGRKVAVAAVQFACTDTVADNVAAAERYGFAQVPVSLPLSVVLVTYPTQETKPPTILSDRSR